MERKERHVHAGHSSAEGLDLPLIMVRSGIGKGMVVLDLGCGKGDYSLASSEMVGPKGQVYSLDSDADSLMDLADQVYSSERTNIMMIRSDMTKGIPLEDGEADVVLLFNVLHGLVHNEEMETPLKEVARVLKVDGTLSIMEPIPGKGGRGPPEDIRISSSRIAEILTPYGLERIGESEVSDERCLVLLRKVRPGKGENGKNP